MPVTTSSSRAHKSVSRPAVIAAIASAVPQAPPPRTEMREYGGSMVMRTSDAVARVKAKWFGGSAMHDLNPISRRLAILAAVAAVALLGGAARYPGTYSPADAAKLDKLSAYLNGIHTLKSNFVQLG